MLTAMVHLISSQIDYNAKQVVKMMFQYVYKLHGLPKDIVTDWGSLFTSTFWQHLYQLVGMKLKLLGAYHLQTDGLTERANKTVTQMLQKCTNPRQTDWVTKLPAVEFAINFES